MNTNSIPETQTVKAKDNTYIFGDRAADYNDKYALFTLPKGHVIYVINKDEHLKWSWFEEHVNMTKVQMDSVYSEITIYTEEGNEYTLEVDAFMTVRGAMTACESREIFVMQQEDIEHLNDIIDFKEMRTYPDD